MDEDTVMMDALDSGAEDFSADGPVFEITTDPDSFNDVVAALEQKGYTFESAELEMVPQNYVTMTGEDDGRTWKSCSTCSTTTRMSKMCGTTGNRIDFTTNKTHPDVGCFFRLNQFIPSYSRANDYDGLAVCRRKEWLEMISQVTDIYESIAQRTDGNIYIGVVGPVRTGKSTFIKRFMQTQILPGWKTAFAGIEPPTSCHKSGSGRTIMTAEPKFVPEEAAHIKLAGGAEFGVRLVDCVGYLIPRRHGAI